MVNKLNQIWLVLFLWGCPMKNEFSMKPDINPAQDELRKISLTESSTGSSGVNTALGSANSKTQVLSTLTEPQKKELRKNIFKVFYNSLKFVASLETEVFKLVYPQSENRIWPLDVLAYAASKEAGLKITLKNYDCQRLEWVEKDEKLLLQKQCSKPPLTLAQVTPIFLNKVQEPLYYTIEFMNENWENILGPSAQLQAENRECTVVVVRGQVTSYNCKNTFFSTELGGLNLQEIRLPTFAFKRNSEGSSLQDIEMVQVKGAFYKDLIEVKKISLTIPLTGKIKIIEKELKVRDDFADLQNQLLGLSTSKTQTTSEVSNATSTKKNEKQNSSEQNDSEHSGSGEKNQQENPQIENPHSNNDPANYQR